jgi:hypothetical protein
MGKNELKYIISEYGAFKKVTLVKVAPDVF